MTTPDSSGHRTPYVGAGEDGARRSARIDRDEADGLAWTDDRQYELLTSAERWEQQAYELMLARLGPRPTLDQVRHAVGSESWLAALALLDLSPAVRADVARFAEWSRDSGHYSYTGDGDDQVATFHPIPVVAWDKWLADVDEQGRGWSTTEHSLAQLVAALVDKDRAVTLHDALAYHGSYEGDVWRILTHWGTGGNNRDRPGRYTVQEDGYAAGTVDVDAPAAGLTSGEPAATTESGLTTDTADSRPLPQPQARPDAEGLADAGPEMQDQQQQAADETTETAASARLLDDLDRAFNQALAAAIETAARLVADAGPDERPAVVRGAATRIADLVDVDGDGIDGQAAVDALTAAARRVGMARTEVEAAIKAGFAQSRDAVDVEDHPTAPSDPDLRTTASSERITWHQDGNDGRFPEGSAVLVRFPLPDAARAPREEWPWLPGHVLEQCGPEEWHVVVDGVPELAEWNDDDVFSEEEPLYPACFRDPSELRLPSTLSAGTSPPRPSSSRDNQAAVENDPAPLGSATTIEPADVEQQNASRHIDPEPQEDPAVRATSQPQADAATDPRVLGTEELTHPERDQVAESRVHTPTDSDALQGDDMADLGESAVADADPPAVDGPRAARGTAASSLREAAFAVAEARISEDGSVTAEEVDQLTGAAYAALAAWDEPAADPPQAAETSTTTVDEAQHVELPQDTVRPAAAPRALSDPHTDLDDAIGHAQAAVAHLGAVHHRSQAEAAGAAVHDDHPAYWAEPEVEL